MPGYMVYVPRRQGCSDEHLRAVGLDGLCGEPGLTTAEGSGPDGGRGVILTWLDPRRPELTPEPVYRSELQEWAASKNAEGEPDGRCWFGRLAGLPVEPESLRRKVRHAGEDVILEDEQAWHVPVARQLPHLIGIGRPRVVERYRPFYDATLERIERWLHAGDHGPAWMGITLSEGFEFACACLAVNYRVTRDVVDWLGLITSRNMFAFLDVSSDGLCSERVLHLAQKKTAPEAPSSMAVSPNTSAGGPG